MCRSITACCPPTERRPAGCWAAAVAIAVAIAITAVSIAAITLILIFIVAIAPAASADVVEDEAEELCLRVFQLFDRVGDCAALGLAGADNEEHAVALGARTTESVTMLIGGVSKMM